MIQWFARDWGLKLISLALAIGLWYYAVGEEGIEVKRSIPLEIKLQNPQMSILESSVENVLVTFNTPRALLSDLTSESIKAVHEIGGEVKAAGDYSFRLEPREIQLPTAQIRVEKIEPEVIQVTLDELIVQKLPIKPNFSGEPAFGYKLNQEGIQLNPNAILVEGPKGQLLQLDAVVTERIDLVGRIRSFRRTVALDLPAHVKPLSEALVDAYIPITEEFEEKSFNGVPIKILRAPEGVERIEVTPPEISFVLKGSVRQLERLMPEQLLAYVDASDLSYGEHKAPVEIVLPEDVSLKEGMPVMVVLNIRRR